MFRVLFGRSRRADSGREPISADEQTLRRVYALNAVVVSATAPRPSSGSRAVALLSPLLSATNLLTDERRWGRSRRRGSKGEHLTRSPAPWGPPHRQGDGASSWVFARWWGAPTGRPGTRRLRARRFLSTTARDRNRHAAINLWKLSMIDIREGPHRCSVAQAMRAVSNSPCMHPPHSGENAPS